MENQNLGQELVNKIAETVSLTQIHGHITRDAQLIFIAETIRIVLQAANNYESAMCLHKHICEFIEEKKVMDGEKSLGEYLVERATENSIN